jgi:hypothetical protein
MTNNNIRFDLENYEKDIPPVTTKIEWASDDVVTGGSNIQYHLPVSNPFIIIWQNIQNWPFYGQNCAQNFFGMHL